MAKGFGPNVPGVSMFGLIDIFVYGIKSITSFEMKMMNEHLYEF